MPKEYKQIEGEFIIMKDGSFFIDKRELQDYDKVHLSIRVLKNIIADAKLGVI